MPSEKDCDIKPIADKSETSPKTKVVKIVKLKRIKFPPCDRTNAKKKKVLRNGSEQKTRDVAKIKIISEMKLEPVGSDAISNESVQSKDSNHTEREEYVHVRKRNRYCCYQCEMEPRIHEPSDPRRHICLFCPIRFSNHCDFEIHVTQIHNKNPNYVLCKDFYCYVCQKKFDFRQYLTQHLKSHKETSDHLCTTCGACFKTRYLLTAHMQIHNEKTFECDQCDKKFKLFVRYRKHLWCHNTNLSFVCQVCSKAFKMKKYLKLHMAIHDEPKIHCRICDATFHFKSVRRAHEKARHNVM